MAEVAKELEFILMQSKFVSTMCASQPAMMMTTTAYI